MHNLIEIGKSVPKVRASISKITITLEFKPDTKTRINRYNDTEHFVHSLRLKISLLGELWLRDVDLHSKSLKIRRSMKLVNSDAYTR